MINVTLMTIILITSAVPPKAHFPIAVTSQDFTALEGTIIKLLRNCPKCKNFLNELEMYEDSTAPTTDDVDKQNSKSVTVLL